MEGGALHRENLQSDREETGNLKIEFKLGSHPFDMSVYSLHKTWYEPLTSTLLTL